MEKDNKNLDNNEANKIEEDGLPENKQETGNGSEDRDILDEEDQDNIEVDDILTQRDELQDKLMRALAENENIRKRAIKERKDAETYGISKLSRDILSVYDNLKRALELAENSLDKKSLPLIEGLELTQKDLIDILKRNQIEKVEPKEGDKFDPKLHQAMFEGPSDTFQKGSIMKVMSTGFLIGERLLRASQVAVSSGPVKIDQEKEMGQTEGET